MGDELGTSVRGDMCRDSMCQDSSMFRKHIFEIKLSHTFGGHFVCCWEEQGLFGQAVDDYQNGGISK